MAPVANANQGHCITLVTNASQARFITLERFLENAMSCLGKSGFSNSTSSSLPLTMPSHSSREPNCVDSLINNLLQAVTNDAIPFCTSCEEPASFNCRDCPEVLCAPCVLAHQRVRITKDHRVVKFNTDAHNIPESLKAVPSKVMLLQASNSGTSTMGPPNFCDINHEHRLYCETCFKALCTDCMRLHKDSHQVIYIQDAIEIAKNNTVKLRNEARAAMTAVREALVNVQKRSEAIAIHTHKAKSDVSSITKRYVAVLQEREQELLLRIEQIRQMKGKALNSQILNLEVALSKLAHLSDLLTESLEINTVELISVNERAASQLEEIRDIRSGLPPCEEDNIVFSPPDANLLRAISTFGGLHIATNNNINLLRPHLKDLQINNSLTFMPLNELKDDDIVVNVAPRGNAILGVTKPIIARETLGVPLIIGSEGEGDGQLCRPWGVCCDRNGNIIVGDRSNNRIQIFHPNGVFSHKFGSQGSGPGQFDRPAGVAVDPSGRIVVSDKDNHRIQILLLDGTFVLSFGEKGSRNGQFNYPWDVAVNSIGHIVVSDTRNHRIQIFSNDGTFLNKYGFEGTTPMWKHFDSPRGVCFTPIGSILVTDFNNHRIVIIDHRFTQAQFLGSEGSGFKQFLRPQGIICDDEGHIIVADSRNNRIQIFQSNGTFLWQIRQQGGKGPGELDRPSGICLTPEGRIVVVDFGNDRVQIF